MNTSCAQRRIHQELVTREPTLWRRAFRVRFRWRVPVIIQVGDVVGNDFANPVCDADSGAASVFRFAECGGVDAPGVLLEEQRSGLFARAPGQVEATAVREVVKHPVSLAIDGVNYANDTHQAPHSSA